jgi:hypothetical protein
LQPQNLNIGKKNIKKLIQLKVDFEVVLLFSKRVEVAHQFFFFFFFQDKCKTNPYNWPKLQITRCGIKIIQRLSG